MAAGIAPAALVARLGLPALGALVFLAVLTAGVTCWLLGSDARTARVSRVLLAWRGNPGCLASGSTVAPAPSAPQPRRWPWPRVTRGNAPLLLVAPALRGSRTACALAEAQHSATSRSGAVFKPAPPPGNSL